MRYFVFILFFLFYLISFSQLSFEGVWQGILIPNGKKMEQSNPFYMEVKLDGNKCSGLTREEIFGTEFYAIGKFYGSVSDNSIDWKHIIYQKKQGAKINWCKLNAQLVYNEKTGYLEGSYSSSDCRNTSGKIILFRSKAKFSAENIPIVSQSARNILANDLAQNRPAPAVRLIERQNFKFEPIFFDYDKAEIRSVDIAFLNSIVEVVEGHSDLRIKVIGNTDADGSDIYNDDLSKRRAEAIISFFVEKGLNRDRIEIQFNGEKKPIDSNETPEGKQKNRRVEFEFI